MKRAILTLREVETNRVVKVWESSDERIFEQFLEGVPEAARLAGEVPGTPWGERGLVYRSVFSESESC